MMHGIVPQVVPASAGNSKPLKFWTLFTDAFSAAECAQLTQFHKLHDANKGGLVDGSFDQDIRRSTLVWLSENKALHWVDIRLGQLIATANRQLFGYALDGFEEQFQLAAYGPGHYYDWHIDRGHGMLARRRKLTLLVQLTKSECYVGGALEVNANGNPVQIPGNQGTAVVFASTTLHRVKPVTSGLRHSLVAWTHGPAFV